MGISAPAGSLREIRGLRGELGQFAKRMSENNSSLRSQIAPLRSEMRAEIRVLNTRIDAVGNQLNTHIDALGMQVNARIDELTQRLDDALNVRQCLIRNFRFASPISTSGIRQPASLLKGLAQFWSTVPPAAPGGVGLASRGHATARNAVFPIDSADTSPSPPLHRNLLRPAGRLSGRHRQRHNSLQHAAKQPARQVALRQQQPVVAGGFDQTTPGFHQPLLQAGQRPLVDPCRQRQTPPQIAQVVGNYAQPQPRSMRAPKPSRSSNSRTKSKPPSEVTREPWNSTFNRPLNESSKGCSCLSPTATLPPHSPDRAQTLVCQGFSCILSSW